MRSRAACTRRGACPRTGAVALGLTLEAAGGTVACVPAVGGTLLQVAGADCNNLLLAVAVKALLLT